MNPGEFLADMQLRTDAGTDQDVEQLEDTTKPEEMYGGVIGHRAPGVVVVPDPEPGA